MISIKNRVEWKKICARVDDKKRWEVVDLLKRESKILEQATKIITRGQ